MLERRLKMINEARRNQMDLRKLSNEPKNATQWHAFDIIGD